MDGRILIQIVVFLGVAAFAAPIARILGLGSILGYLLAGAFIGPYGVGKLFGYSVYDAEGLRQIAELGVAMLLFLIGLELRPRRLWKMREAVFGAGSAQLGITGILLVGLIFALAPRGTYTIQLALLIGVALALSSTAFALQTLEERGELTARHGRLSFSILLFQDLAAIPLIALVPLFAAGGTAEQSMSFAAAVRALAAIALIIIIGRYLLDRLYRILASSHVREAMLAAGLLTVAAVTLLMTEIGMSPSLGTFIAGVLLADSAFRHQLNADIEPFEMLLLALFFTSIGMTLNYEVLLQRPTTIAAGVAGLVAVKFAVLYFIGRWQGLDTPSSRRFAIVTSQGGEFAFVVFASAHQVGVLSPVSTATLGIIVTLSMVTTPLLLNLDDVFRKKTRRTPAFDEPPSKEGHVVIAGFGRVGQIVARVLSAKGIPITALDDDADQVQLVNRFGNKSYFGDATRLAILEAAETNKARAFVLAIDDVEASLKTAQLVRMHFPHVPIFARARNRRHVHRLIDLGVKHIERETFLSSLALTRDVLRGLGLPEGEIRFIVDSFKEHDERLLREVYAHYTDTQKVTALSLQRSEELADILSRDWQVAAADRARREEGRKGRDKSRQAFVDDKVEEEK